MAHPTWQRALAPTEERLAWQVADDIEEALGSRDPALVLELAAQLIGQVIFENAARLRGAIAPTADMCEEVLAHVVDRITVIAAKTRADFMTAAPAAGAC